MTYCLSLVFTLRTHRSLYGAARAATTRTLDADAAQSVGAVLHAARGDGRRSPSSASCSLAPSTEAATTLGMIAALRRRRRRGARRQRRRALLGGRRWRRNNQMDAAIAIAVGSSTQIALFVAPVLVFLSYVVGPQPMDLLFTVFELVAIGLSRASASPSSRTTARRTGWRACSCWRSTRSSRSASTSCPRDRRRSSPSLDRGMRHPVAAADGAVVGGCRVELLRLAVTQRRTRWHIRSAT